MEIVGILRGLATDYTLQSVALGTAALGIVNGVLGSFAVLRRQSLLGDAISHAALDSVSVGWGGTRYGPALKLAQEKGLRITNVIDTHMHADHVSGLSSLTRKTGAQAFIGSAEGYKVSDGAPSVNLVSDGQKISVGEGVSLTAIHTPGHTEGSTSYLLEISSGGDKVAYLFTGDTLFVNAVGRPDLHDKAAEFAANLHDTYQNKLLKLPENTVVLPAHFDTGTITLKHGELVSETIGSVKRNVKLLTMPKEEFVQFMSASVPPRPANYRMIIQINRELVGCEEINMGDLEAGPNSCAIKM